MFGKFGKLQKVIRGFCLIALCLCGLFCFVGCQSTDKAEVYFDSSAIENATVVYNASINATKVTFPVAFENNTIYDIKEASITFALYKDGVQVVQKSYSYNKVIKHGDAYEGKFSFSYDGEIDAVKYERWEPRYRSFWGTYKIWLIVLISVTSVAVLVYIISVFAFDFDLSDDGWVIILLICVSSGGLIGGFIESWVSGLLVLGALVVFSLAALVTHLIKENV